MTKNAAKFKPVRKENRAKMQPADESFDIERDFGNIKQVMVNTAEVQVLISGRVDNLINLRAAAYKFWGNELDAKMMMSERMDYFHKLLELTERTYDEILATVKTFELEEFLKDDMKDYFEHIVPVTESIVTEKDLFEAQIVSDCVRPWGEKMTQLHHQMLEERKAMEAEEV